MTHTPTGLHYQRAHTPDNTGGYDYALVDANGKIMAEVFQNVDYDEQSSEKYDSRPAEDNAARLAHCWNHHDDLVAALEFYAFEGNWLNDCVEAAGAPAFVPHTCPAEWDHGGIALMALAKVKTRPA